MGVADDGCSDQHKNAGPNDGADSEARKVPGCQGLSEAVGRMLGVGKDLFKRLGSEQRTNHRASVDGITSQGRSDDNIVTVHGLSSIAGRLRSAWNADDMRSVSFAPSRFKEGLEQPAMAVEAIEEKFRVPLDAE